MGKSGGAPRLPVRWTAYAAWDPLSRASRQLALRGLLHGRVTKTAAGLTHSVKGAASANQLVNWFCGGGSLRAELHQ